MAAARQYLIFKSRARIIDREKSFKPGSSFIYRRLYTLHSGSMRDVVPPVVDFSHSTADFQTLLFPSSYGSSAAAKGDRGGGTAEEQQRILTTASLGRPDLVLEATATTTTTGEGAAGLFGVSSSSCLLAPNSPPQQTRSSSAHHHHQQTFFRAQHRQGLERSQTVVEQQQPLQQLPQGEGRQSLPSACQERGEGGAGRGGLNMSTQQELHQLQQQENHLGIIASNLATQQSLPVGPLSQQQANGNQLGFAPHHQQANSMHGGRHQANNNNSNMRPPFEDEQRRAYTEQHQAQQQQQQQQHHHQQQQHQQQQLSYGMMFDDMFPVTAATSMNMMGSRAPAAAMGGPNADPRLLEYPQQHFQQAGGLNAIRNYVLDNSSQYQQMDNHMMQYGADPWDSMEMFAPMDAPKDSYYGGHPIMQQRSSLTHEAMMFPRGQMPPSSQTGQGSYLGQFDASRRPPPSRMMPDTRNWLPSLTYDSNGNVPAGALVAPPRSMAPRPSTARSGSGSVAYQPQVSQGRKTSAPSSGRSRDDAISKKPRSSHSPMAGENRLKITFIGIGTPGEAPQHFGTKGYIIPNGLAGMHQVYHQRWRFDTKHVKIDDVICVSWSITNLASGTTSQRTETPREARVRETSGHTICNQLLRQALKSRAAELEATLDSLRDNMTKFSNTENLIKALRPKSCILGLLFFGLLHDTVQQRMRDLLGITTPLHQMASAHLMVGAGGEVEGNGSASSGLDHGGSPGSGGELGSI